MKIKVPFKSWRLITEKEIDFVFNIGTLECATEEILKCDLFDVSEQNPYDVNVAILYAGYLIACEKLRKRKRYDLSHATFWMEHMSKTSQEEFLKAVKSILGKMAKGSEEKKK